MITTSVPRSGWARVTTAPPARIGRPGERTPFLPVPVTLSEGTEPLLHRDASSTLGVDQILLHVQQRIAVFIGGVRNPAAIRQQVPRRRALVEGDVEQLANLTDVRRIGDRNKHLDATVEVAVHEVRGADPDRGGTIVGEPEETAVLEETAKNAAHPDVLAEPRHAWPDCAGAAHP